jgi:hypothetical protein
VKYLGDVKPYAIQIATEEMQNPYEDETPNPLLPLPSHLGFQQQIAKVYSRFTTTVEPGKELDFDACKKKRLICNFDPTPRGRNEVQKNKWTPLNGESEKNNRFAPRELLFLTKYGS